MRENDSFQLKQIALESKVTPFPLRQAWEKQSSLMMMVMAMMMMMMMAATKIYWAIPTCFVYTGCLTHSITPGGGGGGGEKGACTITFIL